MKISLFCPSRGRPTEAQEVLEAFLKNTTRSDVELVFLVDDDDPTAPQYPGSVVLGPPTGSPTGPLNRAALASESDIVGFTGDDSRIETKGWDQRVVDALREPGFCWTSDSHDWPWPSTIFVSRTIPETLGWLVLPELRRGFFDVVWVELARLTQSARMLDDVLIRHDNSAGDPASPNFQPERLVPPAIIAGDQVVFDTWMKVQARSDAQRLRRVLYSYA